MATPTRGNSKPNIVIIVLDTVRARNVSCYGNHRVTTPNIDSFAEDGTRFVEATSASPWTLPSHASLFTGVPPATHRTNSLASRLPGSLVTLASMLSKRGYETVGMTTNPWLSSKFGITRGFDSFHHLITPFDGDSYREFVNILTKSNQNAISRITTLLSKQGPRDFLKNVANGVYRYTSNPDDDGAMAAVERANEVIGTSDPYLLFVNLMEPHLPYEPPPHYSEKFLAGVSDSIDPDEVNQNARDYNVRNTQMSPEEFDVLERLYDAEIKYADEQVGRLFDRLESAGELDDSLVVILGDHGENIGDHELMSHNYSLHETVLRIPLILRFPGVFDGGEVVDSRVSTLDIPATICDLVTNDAVEFRSQQTGVSLRTPDRRNGPIVAEYLNPVPPIERMKERCENPEFDVSRYARRLRVVYDDGYKLIRSSDGERELYELPADRDENRDLSAELPGKADELQSTLERWVRTHDSEVRAKEQPLDDQKMKQRLERLGYL